MPGKVQPGKRIRKKKNQSGVPGRHLYKVNEVPVIVQNEFLKQRIEQSHCKHLGSYPDKKLTEVDNLLLTHLVHDYPADDNHQNTCKNYQA